MKTTLPYIWIIIAAMTPILLVLVVNEFVRANQHRNYSYRGISTIHSDIASTEKCTWHCHRNTEYCKQHHVTILKSSMDIIDPVYSGIIQALGSTGNYRLANVVFLALLWPLGMLALIVWLRRMYQTLGKVA